MFDTDTSERPDVQETYEVATQTSSLKVETHRQGAADVIIAAGWSESRVGMALLRLHSEWDGAAKPRRATEAQVKAMAAQFPDAKGKPSVSRARAEATVWYARELRLLALSLKSRASVLEQVHAWAVLKGLDPASVAPALFHWLSCTCPVCDGHGLRKVPDQPALSAKQCHACHGSGKTPRPEGAARIQNWLDECTQKARQSLKRRLRAGG
jgi:hypothetical protein